MSNSLQLRQFDKQFHFDFLSELTNVLGLASKSDLPPVFRLPVAVALSEGAHEALMSRFSEYSPDPHHVSVLLARYRKTVQYHYAMMNGEAVYNIDLQPEGKISEQERILWEKRFAHLKAQHRLGNRKTPMNDAQRRFSRV